MAKICHLAYSHDLELCDLWLFDTIKRYLTDAVDKKDLKRQITRALKKISQEEYLKTFKKYLERLQLCIDNHGDYFEHLIK